MRIRVLLPVVLAVANNAAQAQFTADYQTNIISGVVSNWSGDYLVGSNTFANALVIQNSAVLSNNVGYVGFEVSGSNNAVIVNGGIWQNASWLIVGNYGAGNTLVVSNQGAAMNTWGYLGLWWSSSGNHALVTGSGSVWMNQFSLYVGDARPGNISDQAKVFAGAGLIGSGSDSNSVLVTGPGSVWSNQWDLLVGEFARFNSLVISDQGAVFSNPGYISWGWRSSNNTVLVTGPGSRWRSESDFSVGHEGSSNTLIIADGGQVLDRSGWIGFAVSASNNSAHVTEEAVWHNEESLVIGNLASSNSLSVAGGSVFATNLVIGAASSVCDNILHLESGSVIVTNAAASAVLEVRRGKLILNGGTLRVDQFVMTNACAQFVRTGGALIYGTAILDPDMSAVGDGNPNGWKQQYGFDPFDPGLASTDSDGDGFTNLQEFLAGTDPTNDASVFLVSSVTREGDDIRAAWQTGIGKTNALQRANSIAGSYADIFTVTNTTGTVTNYLDVGAATNAPAWCYRVRLVPSP
jgi:T5SS/PEP-CTERM-associated repeat protein